MDFKGNWYDQLPLKEFSYNNSYHSSISMAPFEKLYGRRCRSQVRWYEVGEYVLKSPNLVYESLEKVHVIRYGLKMAQSWQKSYADNRKKELEFEVGDWVYLKISSMKRVMRLGKNGKLIPRYVGPYEILMRVKSVAYELKFPKELAMIHPVFHVSMLKKCIGKLVPILPLEVLGVKEGLSCEEVPFDILNDKLRILSP